MKTRFIEITLDEAQANLAELCNAAVFSRGVVIIKRPSDPDVALLAAGELSALMETLYLLGSPKNAERLVGALSRARCR